MIQLAVIFSLQRNTVFYMILPLVTVQIVFTLILFFYVVRLVGFIIDFKLKCLVEYYTRINKNKCIEKILFFIIIVV